LDAHGGNVLFRGEAGMRIVQDCVILGRHAKAIVTHGLHHVVAFHQFEPGDGIADGVV
jgi:uncharacterized protein YjaZ